MVHCLARVGLWYCFVWMLGAPAFAADQVSVAVFANDASQKKYERAVQARMETVLADAGVTVLDEEKAKKLRTGWVDLADPSHLVTAEEFLKNAGKYDVKRIYRVSFNSGVTSPLGLFFTATAAVQIRVIDADAKVQAFASSPMGLKGFPPSDALTSDAALVNAMQRGVDSAAEASGLLVSAPTIAKVIPLTLEADPAPPALVPLESVLVSKGDGWTKGAKFFDNGGWTLEDAACKSVSDDGQMGVLGGYTHAKRGHGGRLHIVDIASGHETTVFNLHEIGPRLSGENGTSEPFACQFLGSWRYLIAMTGNKLSCFDVERGLETCSIGFSNGPGKGILSVWKSDTQRYVKAETDKGTSYYHIVLKK
jgi:hypothetical protein